MCYGEYTENKSTLILTWSLILGKVNKQFQIQEIFSTYGGGNFG